MTPALATMYRLNSRGGAGLACDEKGVALGPIALVDALLSNGKCVYRARPAEEIARTLALAYGPFSADDLARRLRGLDVAARALEAGDLAKAGIATVLLKLPPLTPEAFAKLARESTLRKYSPDQPRDERGRWIDEDAAPTQTAANHTAAADEQVAQIPPSFFARPPGIVRPPILRPPLVRPPLEQYPTDATKPPAPGWEWKGKNPTPGSREGNWRNPKTKESLHPILIISPRPSRIGTTKHPMEAGIAGSPMDEWNQNRQFPQFQRHHHRLIPTILLKKER